MQTKPDNIPTRSPFDAAVLANVLNNDNKACPAFRSILQSLIRAVDRTAEQVAKDAAEWHDDITADDHEAYHAPARIQYPRPVRRAALLDLIAQHLEAIDGNEGARFWPEDFRKLSVGDVVTLNDGTPALVEAIEDDEKGPRARVVYRESPGFPPVWKSVTWQDITKNV